MVSLGHKVTHLCNWQLAPALKEISTWACTWSALTKELAHANTTPAFTFNLALTSTPRDTYTSNWIWVVLFVCTWAGRALLDSVTYIICIFCLLTVATYWRTCLPAAFAQMPRYLIIHSWPMTHRAINCQQNISAISNTMATFWYNAWHNANYVTNDWDTALSNYFGASGHQHFNRALETPNTQQCHQRLFLLAIGSYPKINPKMLASLL